MPWTRKRKLQSRLLSWLSTRLVPVSEDLARHARVEQGAPQRKVELIYNGIDLQAFELAAEQASLGQRDPRPTAVMVARLAPVKDFDTLFQAAAVVRQRQPEFRLRLLGDGPLRAELEGTAERMGLKDCIELLGNRRDVPQQLAAADVFILSSHSEGLSIAVLEAMATGLPVVATAVGGNPEVVADGETGFLVPERSPQIMAEKIVWLLEHADQAREMGRAGRRRVAERFDIRGTVREYQRLYLDLARGHGAKAAGARE